nr:hypothetical protein Iba_chr05cCG13570 [Ipomoea batatas]
MHKDLLTLLCCILFDFLNSIVRFSWYAKLLRLNINNNQDWIKNVLVEECMDVQIILA